MWKVGSDGYEVEADDGGDLGVEGFDAEEEGEVGQFAWLWGLIYTRS